MKQQGTTILENLGCWILRLTSLLCLGDWFEASVYHFALESPSTIGHETWDIRFRQPC